MAKKRPIWIFVVLGVILLLTGLTIYVNRIVLPVQIKKIAITQAKDILKRNVEIGNLRFSWVKGLILDDVRIFQRDSSEVFFQSRRISLGLIFIPGFKEHQVTIPYIDIIEPKVSLLRKGTQEWNFSDLLTLATAKNDTPSNIKVKVLGVNLIAGQLTIDDTTTSVPFHQELSDVNVKVGLSLNGIAFDTRANLNKTNGLFNIQGTFQPLSQTLDAHVLLQNIRPSQYLSLIPPIPELTVTDSFIKEINVDTHYDANLFSIKGDVNVTDINVSFKSMKMTGSVEANINQCDLRKDSVNIDTSIIAQNASLTLSPSERFNGTFNLQKVRIRQDKDGTQVVGTIKGQKMDVFYNGQTIRGDLLARPITVEMKNADDIDIQGDFVSNFLEIGLNEHQSFSGKVNINESHIHITDKKDITFEGKVNLSEITLVPMDSVQATGSMDLKDIVFSYKNDVIKVKTNAAFNNWQINLDTDKTIVMEASVNLNATYPIKSPETLTYSGDFSVDHAEVTGYPYGPFNEITANGDFKTDQVSLKLFSVVALDSAFKGAATILNFKNPVVSVDIVNKNIDLGKLKSFIPDIFSQYGLTTKGNASFNASFEGLAFQPLSGKINVKAQFQGVDVASSKFNQSISNLTGSIEGTPNSLAWKDFSGIYLEKKYTLTGKLDNFTAPQIKTTLNGDDIKLDVSIDNINNAWVIHKLIGKYFDIVFDATGKISLPADLAPLVDIQTSVNLNIEKALPLLPLEQRKLIEPYGLQGTVKMKAHVGGHINDWRRLSSNATIHIPSLSVMGYHLNDISASINQQDGKLSNTTIDAIAYTGKVHSVINLDLIDDKFPFDLALNVDNLDLQQLQKDIPALKGKDIKGKFYVTTVGKGKAVDITNFSGKGSLAIREGFLTEFKIFEGLLGILNEVMRLGQMTITDVEGNFTIDDKKVTTQNLRLISPTIVLLTEGWIDLNQMCDLKVSVDMTSGVIPPVAEQVLRTLSIRIYDKISAPKFNKKISVPQVINSLIKTLGILQ